MVYPRLAAWSSTMAWVSCFPVTVGTTTVGMLGPPLTTRFTAEFFDTDAPDFGSVDRTCPLAVLLARTVLVPTVRLSLCRVWVAWPAVSPTTLGTVTLLPNTPIERRRKK